LWACCKVSDDDDRTHNHINDDNDDNDDEYDNKKEKNDNNINEYIDDNDDNDDDISRHRMLSSHGSHVSLTVAVATRPRRCGA